MKKNLLNYITSSLWAVDKDYGLSAIQSAVNLAANENNKILTDSPPSKITESNPNDDYNLAGSGIAVLPITGVLFPRANLFSEISGGESVSMMQSKYLSLLADNSIRTIILHVDSPGGNADSVQEFAELIYDNREKKRVISFVSNRAASGGYWIASAASEVYAGASAYLGSIGVFAVLRKDDEDPSRIEFVSSQSPKKRQKPGTEDGNISIQQAVDNLADVFISSVAKFRGKTSAAVQNDFGGGGIMIAGQGMAAGMTDGITTLFSLISKEKKRGLISMDDKAIYNADVSDENEGQPALKPQMTAKPKIDFAVQSGIDAERKRCLEIMDMCLPAYAQYAADFITAGVSAEAAAVKMLAVYKGSQAKTGQPAGNKMQQVQSDYAQSGAEGIKSAFSASDTELSEAHEREAALEVMRNR